MQDYWHKQAPGKPLFPELEWSRPENKAHAGKLLIVGGHAQSFAAPAEAYGEAMKARVGTARVVLPDALHKTVGQLFPAAEFCTSNPSGGFAQQCLGELLAIGQWADGVLLAGDFGRNSETAILLEKFLDKYSGQATLTKDAVDYFTATPLPLLRRENVTLVLSFAQLQKLAMGAKFTKAFTFDLGLLQLVELLHDFTEQFSVNIVTKHLENIFVAAHGQISSTKLEQDIAIWRTKTAAHAAVWWLQNPGKSFEALSTAVVEK
ncbi:MAG TPA: hypothetical protein VHD60_00560 [Candidatus Saccharimonadales bacterium]|nr:hypothetical protein [Candidatus Saccharimonadales bacterium]